ncbi:Uma2 family endonuclease [Phormidium sp. CLA17]|uniref:Uma2 family endonuclease n=1 Tax=Leptolyngbya sp. Cla-17 TaxID=2803751 RepID=UPI00149222C1|nr:Uma2 family endonuclease [Leptolyngbya sp. Cla-17]MBM0743449.1 Uma2 family endonuclease [Leptolyngbya sp. Cla-17]
MSPALPKTLTIEEFLKLPNLEESPAWEFVNGQPLRKPVPKARHSILQQCLLSAIDDSTNDYSVLPEFRCTFGDRSVVPDVAVIAWSQLQFNSRGEPKDEFLEAPRWSIEILSPAQKAAHVIDNLLHCLQYGCQLGWMIDLEDYSIWVFEPRKVPKIYRGDRTLPVLARIHLTMTVTQIFEWLQTQRC